jgi:hypothetical protein
MKRSRRPSIPTHRRRRARLVEECARLVENVLAVVEEWQEHHRAHGAGLNLFVESMLLEVDWDRVAPSSLRDVFASVCAGLSFKDLERLSSHAGTERSWLNEVRKAEHGDVSVTLDPSWGAIVDKLQSNPSALRMAVGFAAALGGNAAMARQARKLPWR